MLAWPPRSVRDISGMPRKISIESGLFFLASTQQQDDDDDVSALWVGVASYRSWHTDTSSQICPDLILHPGVGTRRSNATLQRIHGGQRRGSGGGSRKAREWCWHSWGCVVFSEGRLCTSGRETSPGGRQGRGRDWYGFLTGERTRASRDDRWRGPWFPQGFPGTSGKVFSLVYPLSIGLDICIIFTIITLKYILLLFLIVRNEMFDGTNTIKAVI